MSDDDPIMRMVHAHWDALPWWKKTWAYRACLRTSNRFWYWWLGAEVEAKTPDKSGWVIEGAWSEVSAPSYWCGSSAWSEDHMRALRFARKEDAEQAAFFMLDGMNIRIAEHIWTDKP